VVVNLVPRQPAGGVRLQVRDQPVGVRAALLVPDQFVEHELVADVRVARRHEPREGRRRFVVPHGLGYRAIVPVAEDDPSAHEVVGVGHLVDHVLEGFDAELREQVPVVLDRRRPPRVEADAAVGYAVGSFAAAGLRVVRGRRFVLWRRFVVDRVARGVCVVGRGWNGSRREPLDGQVLGRFLGSERENHSLPDAARQPHV
jgi:hypothetical protein